MIATTIYRGGVNVRQAPSVTGDPLFMTPVPAFATLLGKAKLDGDPYTWLHVEFDDGTQGYTRADVSYVIGDLSLIGGGKYADPVLASTVFPPVGAAPVQPPAVTPQGPQTSAGKFPCPVNPSTNENGYHHVYAGVVHDGDDLAGPLGSPILASASGVVFLAQKSAHGKHSVMDEGLPLNSPAVLNDAGWSYGYGNVCIVRYARTALPSAAQQAIADPWVFVLTAHCDDLTVVTGGTVSTGLVLGHRGQSGNAQGVHVHLAVMTSKDAAPANVWALPKVDPGLVFQLPAAI